MSDPIIKQDRLDDGDRKESRPPMALYLTSEQYERLFAPDRGVRAGPAREPLKLGSGAFMGMAGTAVSMFVLSTAMMGWRQSGLSALPALSAVFTFMGGVPVTIAGIQEWIAGNSFVSGCFVLIGGFWFSFGMLQDPMHQIISAFPNGSQTPSYNAGVAAYPMAWAILVAILLVASFRVNWAFVVMLSNLLIMLVTLTIGLYTLADAAPTANGAAVGMRWIKASGVFAFLTSIVGWYVTALLCFPTTGMPIHLPVGDLSPSGRATTRAAAQPAEARNA